MEFDKGSLRVGLLLVDMFPFYGAIMATECMRLANRYANRQVFSWIYVSETGKPATASNGMSLSTEAATNVNELDYALVIAGYDQDREPQPRLKGLLRRLKRHGAVVGAVDSGAFLLADAGLLTGERPALHFESLGSFRHRFPDIETSAAPVSISPQVISCAGGALVIFLILSVVRKTFGDLLAKKIEDDLHLMQLFPHRNDEPRIEQRRKRRQVADVIDFMQHNLDEPLKLRDLAQHAGYSIRELNRAFNDSVRSSPVKYYQRLRLDQARQLLYQGTEPISDVALACGFTSLSAFSRAFKNEFGQSPTKLMATFRREGFTRFIPTAQKCDSACNEEPA